MPYLGVDLRTTTNHPSAVSVIDDDAQVVFIGSFSEDSELLDIVQRYQPGLIAIGTPLGLPEGLCCLESSCKCKLVRPQNKGRQSELELARMGISCFFTNKGSIIRRLIYRAIQLKDKQVQISCTITEVYPHATKVILFGDKVPPKNSPQSLVFMRERVPNLIGGLDSYLEVLNRNAWDSLISSYTALLHSRNETDILGTAKEGFVALPKLIQMAEPAT